MFDLRDKVALVTGAGSGIGAAIAQALAESGAYVYVTDRDAHGGQAITDMIKQNNGESSFLSLDVAEEKNCQRVAETVLGERGHLNILVNNAGIGHVGTILQTEGSDLDRLYQVNVKGVFNMSKVFLPDMLKRRSGVITNLASIGGVVGVSDRVAYCATKFAVVGITKSMALDHATDGIRVNCICPGRVETPFVQARLREYPDPEKAYREMAATQPVGRMGRPAEIAAAAVYLASDEAAFVTGSAFIIDGGFSAGR